MSNKTRKHIWPVALMPLVVAGVLAVVVALSGASPQPAQAHDCEDLSGQERARCLSVHERDGADHDADGVEPDNGNGNGMGDGSHASAPRYFELEGLDNGARLNWKAPKDVATKADVVGYYIHRDAWHPNADHPINTGGDATIKVYESSEIDYTDLGLAYSTTYSYKVLALVRYNRDSDGYSGAVAEWWDSLDCGMMNDVVEGQVSDGPTIGPDDMTSPYCAMYDGLSADTDDAKKNAKAVVRRTYDAKGYNKGEWSVTRTVTTADSGGRLAALLDPPGMVLMLRADPACDNRITVRWSVPDYFGTVPELDENGVYVGPDYIGGERAGKEEVGEDATRVTYQVQRMVNNGAWVAVTPVGTSYTDDTVAYGNTYKYRVRAMNGASLTGPWVMVMEMLVAPDSPLRPSSLVATHGVSSENSNLPAIILQWDAPEDSTADPLWREESDVGTDMNNESMSLQYRIQRKTGNGDWQTLETQRHQYAQDMTASAAINNFRTQRYEDTADAALDADAVSYRVAALVDGCNLSPWNLVDDVEGERQARSLGTPASVAATSGAAGAITVSYTAGANATGHLIILAQGSTLVDFDVSIDGSDASFSNVAAGDYTAIVVSFRRMDGTLEFKHSRSTVTVN